MVARKWVNIPHISSVRTIRNNDYTKRECAKMTRKNTFLFCDTNIPAWCLKFVIMAHILHTSSFPKAKLLINLHIRIFLWTTLLLHFAPGKTLSKELSRKKTENYIISFALYFSFTKLITPRYDTLYERELLPRLWCISNLAKFTIKLNHKCCEGLKAHFNI